MSSLAHIIAFVPLQPGAASSLTAFQMAVGLLRLGYSVGTLDLNEAAPLSGYVASRLRFSQTKVCYLPTPVHVQLEDNPHKSLAEHRKNPARLLAMAVADFQTQVDFLIIDTPGPAGSLLAAALSYSDTLITPAAASPDILECLAEILPDATDTFGPAALTRLVLEARQIRPLDWLLPETGLPEDTPARQMTSLALGRLAEQFKFRNVPGLGDTAQLVQLSAKGLTLLDLREDPETELTLSLVSARQELRSFLSAFHPQHYKGYPQLKGFGA